MTSRKKLKLVYGVGVNDASYETQKSKFKHGESWKCPFYRKWSAMLERCYSASFSRKRQSYKDCAVCDDWKTFSNFKAWMEKQDWSGKHLDKDLIFQGNKVYSPETCCFIDAKLNSFLTDRGSRRGEFMIGVSFDKESNNFKAECSNLLDEKKSAGKNLGRFKSEIEAHLAWKARKHELACQLADIQTDERVANALRTRYL